MILPYRCDVELERRPVVTQALLMANVLLHIFTSSMDTPELERFFHDWGFVPFDYSAGGLVAHMFLHANGLHLAGNMLFLWVFGPPVENRLGSARFAAAYLSFGLASAFGHAMGVSETMIDEAAVGSSGAISGLIGAYTVLYPRSPVRHVAIVVVRPVFFSMPAWLVMGMWLSEQLLLGFYASSINVAIFGHLGGFFAGAGIAKLMEGQVTASATSTATRRAATERGFPRLLNSGVQGAEGLARLGPRPAEGESAADFFLAKAFLAGRSRDVGALEATCADLAQLRESMNPKARLRLALLKQRLGHVPKNVDELLDLGDGLANGPNWKAAMPPYQEFLERAPEHARRKSVLIWLGATLVQRLNLPAAAVPYLKEAAEGDHRSALVQEARYFLKTIEA